MLVHYLKSRSLPMVALCLLCTAGAYAQSTPEAVAQRFMGGFNNGDMATSAALNSHSGTSIIDEFAPYTWSGPKAFDDWGAAFTANAKALGITETKVTLSTPIVRNVTSGEAYLIYPAVYTYQLKGVPTREAARWALVLRKEDAAWKVAAWSWTGTVPKPVK